MNTNTNIDISIGRLGERITQVSSGDTDDIGGRALPRQAGRWEPSDHQSETHLGRAAFRRTRRRKPDVVDEYSIGTPSGRP